MAELFLLILTGVVFCAWLNHKTGFLKDIELDNAPFSYDKWKKKSEENLNNDLDNPSGYLYDFLDDKD